MRVFTLLLFVLTVIAGCLAYYGSGEVAETLKLTYAYLLLSTVASGLITVSMRSSGQSRVAARVQNTNDLLR